MNTPTADIRELLRENKLADPIIRAQAAKIVRVEAQRDALAKALREIVDISGAWEGQSDGSFLARDFLRMRLAARAALAAVEKDEPLCRCTGDGHKPDCEFWKSLEPVREVPASYCPCDDPSCPGSTPPTKALPLGHPYVQGVWQGDFCSFYMPFERGNALRDAQSSRYGDGDPTVPESYCGQPASAHEEKHSVMCGDSRGPDPLCGGCK